VNIIIILASPPCLVLESNRVKMVYQSGQQTTPRKVAKQLGLFSNGNDTLPLRHFNLPANQLSVAERKALTIGNLAKAGGQPVIVTNYDRQGRLIISCAVPHGYHLTAGEFCRLFAKTVVTEQTGRYAYATVDPRK
jgi:hypothetical protein